MEAEKPKSEIAKREEEILKFWHEQKIFEKSLTKPSSKGEFVFYEGPPYANGLPGLHHLEARAFKDVILRYKTMRGFKVPRRAGWDTHGLPIEMAVEKKLGITGKKEIEEKIGIDKFVAEAKANVFFYKAEWEKFTRRIGYWLDFEHAYITMAPEYIESLWWIIKQISERKVNGENLLYQDYKILPWCPRCGTALSSHELAQGYATTTDTAVSVKFKVKNPEQHHLPPNTFLLAWTTTPWTLPGNVALAIGEKIDYVLFQNGDEFLIASQQFTFLAPSDSAEGGVASRGEKQIVAPARPLKKQIPTSQLLNLQYEPLYNFPQLQNEKSHRVYAADFVTTTDGTGIVHTAVMYGQDDFELGTKVGLPKSHLVSTDGTFIVGTPWAGKFVKDADREIIADLERRGLLFKQEEFKHEYPFCWRCKTPLIYYARHSWYIRMSVLRATLLAENQKINWLPAHIRDGRFGEWISEVKDWAISRERYWGTPLPVWQSADGSERVVVGSLAELKARTKKSGNQYFVMRHGEAENNVKGIYSSLADNPHHLTARGRETVKLAAQELRRQKIDLIVSSDFARARETAELIVASLGLDKNQIQYDKRLGEVNYGELDGQSVGSQNIFYKTPIEYFAKYLPGGDNLMDVKQRMGAALYDLETRYQGQNILIITHETPSWLLLATAAGANVTESFALRGSADDFIKNAEVRAFDFVPLPHNQDYELDLHRPFIDELVLIGDSGQELKRAPEVLDVWFDSGAMPFAENHYPFDFAQGRPLSGKELSYPADYIAEAIDQTRGWFYTLLAIGVLLGRAAPYKNVICLGHILDRTGKKMSKSVGNVVEPWSMIDKYGVDVLRFWMYSINQPGDSKNFDEASVNEVVKKMVNPLTNVISFYHLYANKNSTDKISKPKHLLDHWLFELLAELTENATRHLENYQITEAARAIKDFIIDLSQWYVRRSRDRFRGAERQEASATLGAVLIELAKLLAPFMPFLAEDIYQKIGPSDKLESVHLTDWPQETQSSRLARFDARRAVGQAKRKMKNRGLIQNMVEVRRLASLALEARARAGIKIRQPLAKLSVRHRGLPNEFAALLADEVNVKEVVWDEKLADEIILDTNLTPTLVAEGQVRDLVRQIQDLRKQSNLKPGQLAILKISAKHEHRELIEQQMEKLKRVASLSQIEFVNTDVSLAISH